MLEIGSGDKDSINIFAGIQFVIVSDGFYMATTELFNVGDSFFAAFVPEIGDCNELEVELFRVLEEGWNQGALHAVSAADDADTDSLIRANDCGIASCVPCDCGSSDCCRSCFQKVPAIIFVAVHECPL